MNVGSVSNAASMFGPNGPPPPPGAGRMEKGMEGTAKLLGLSTSELQEQLKSGKTLNDLAAAKGVSHDDLIKSIEQGLQAAAPQGVQPPAGFDPSKMAEDIAAGKRPEHHHHRVAGAGGADDRLSQLASALGTDAASLLQQLQSGDASALLDQANPYSKAGSLPAAGLQADVYA